jgi:DNA-binding FadR family transcriptional regulator
MSDMLQKLEKISLVQQVYSQIELMIKNGDWEIGARIPKEADLIELFGVSRNTLREAVRALVQVGLLDTKQGDGTFVTATSELNAILQKRMQNSTIIEILEVRHSLEREAASLACLKRTKLELKQMLHYSKMCRKYFDDHDIDNFVKTDWKLHQSIMTASHNQLLIDIYTNLFEKIQMSINSVTELPNSYDIGHSVLVHAIDEQDTKKAIWAVEDYILHLKKIHSSVE